MRDTLSSKPLVDPNFLSKRYDPDEAKRMVEDTLSGTNDKEEENLADKMNKLSVTDPNNKDQGKDKEEDLEIIKVDTKTD